MQDTTILHSLSKQLARVIPAVALVAVCATSASAQSLKAAPSNSDLIDLLKNPTSVPVERTIFPGLPTIPELAVHSLFGNIFTNQPLLMDAPPFGISFDIPATGISPFVGGAPDRDLLVPLNENDFIDGRTAAVQLGKALFWDMQVGSDGVQACASCHFHAGADNRITNQINPGSIAGDGTLQVRGKNDTLRVSDFPLHKVADVMIPGEPLLNPENMIRDSNDVISSMGVVFREFVDIETPGASAFIAGTNPPVLRPDIGLAVPDPIGAAFQDVRRVEPRNTPTFFSVANNFDNFWDGRARHDFNGGSPHGASDPIPHIFEDGAEGLEATRQLIQFSSTASLSTGPALSNFEMSFDKRSWTKIGKKLLQSGAVPLANQLVDTTDSVLGPLSNQNRTPGMPGLNVSYSDLIEAAFAARLWSNTTEHLEPIADPADPLDGISLVLVAGQASSTNTDEFTQTEANFSLFFGLSVQAYAQILLPNDSPFDRFHDANPNEFLGLVDDIEPGTPGVQVVGLTDRQLLGYDIFQGSNLSQLNPSFKAANCNICHFGPELTEHSITGVQGIFPADLITGEDKSLTGFLLENRLIGPAQVTMELDGLNPALDGLGANAGIGIADKGMYNIGVRPFAEDLSRGADDAFGFPLSLAALALNAGGYPVDAFSDPFNPLPPLPPYLAPHVNGFPLGAEFPNIFQSIFLPDTISPTSDIVVHPSGTFPYPNRVARMGSFKVPQLKNVELTGPYFHNGGMSTLRQVVDFYSRGGDFPVTNAEHRDPLLVDLNVNFEALLTESDKVALVDFLLALTDERVKYELPPFDHPEIIVPVDGAAPDNTGGRDSLVTDFRFQRIPAVGAAGRSMPLSNFLGISSIEGSPGPDHFDSVTDADPLSLIGPFPGVAGALNVLKITGAAPNSKLGLAFGLSLGSSTINIGNCGTITVGLAQPFGLIRRGTTDANGNMTYPLPVPAPIAGMTYYFQMIEPATCTVSNVVSATF